MAMDGLKSYLELVNGLTEGTRQRARRTAKALLEQSGMDGVTSGVQSKVSDLTEEILATGRANREMLQATIANEVERLVSQLGFARAEEVEDLERRIERLEAERRSPFAGAPVTPTVRTASPNATAKKVAAKQAAATKAPVKKAATPPAGPGPAKKAAAKKTAKKVPAKKTAKSAAKRTSAARSDAPRTTSAAAARRAADAKPVQPLDATPTLPHTPDVPPTAADVVAGLRMDES